MTQPENEESLPEVDLVHPELPRVTCEELKHLVDEGANILLVDTRGVSHFQKEHIPGAINIPNNPFPPFTEQMIEIKLSMLPHNRLIIFY